MGFLRLDIDERKKICKYVSFDEFKKKNNTNAMFKAKVKTNLNKSLDKLLYADMIKYINEHLEEEKSNVIITTYYKFICTQFAMKFKQLLEYNDRAIEHAKQTEEDEPISQKDVDYLYNLLDEYKDQYNIEEIDYDLFRRFYVLDCQEEVDEYKQQKENDKLEAEKQYKLGHLDELEKELSDTKEELEKKKQDLKDTEEVVSELSEQLQKYQTALSLDNTRYKLSNILRVNITAMTEKEIYEKLNEEEEKALEKEDYDRVKQLLAAKYFMITAKEVE